jgi:hypothetical protein
MSSLATKFGGSWTLIIDGTHMLGKAASHLASLSTTRDRTNKDGWLEDFTRRNYR